jgi:hypothetical protein
MINLSTKLEKSDLSPDLVAEFLRLCLRARRQPSLLSKVQESARSEAFDWSEAIQLADFEGVSPLIYDTLRGSNVAPAMVLDILHGRYISTASRNIVLFHELETLLQQPTLEDARVIVLKGAALSKVVYDAVALRPMIDLDFFSEPGSVLALQSALKSLEYVAVPEPITKSELALKNEVRFLKSSSGGVWLDLHWDLFNSPYLRNAFSTKWLWDTARTVSFGQGRSLILGPEAQILHLCGHMWLHHHVHRKLLWLHDLAEVVHYYASELDWARLISMAHSYKLVLPLQKTLPMIAQEWGAPIPEGVLEECMVQKVSSEEKQAFAWHTSRDRPSDELIRAHLTRQSGFSQQIHYLHNRLLPTTAFMRYRYDIPHPLLLPFFYLYRLGVGLSIGLKMLWQKEKG